MSGAHATEDRASAGARLAGPHARESGDRPAAVVVDDLSVRLSLQKESVTSLRERAIRLVERRPVETEEFWPLRNVSFTVGRGEAFGIVGRNGAGKSTLLKVIAGVVAPTLGRVEVRGRIAPLLELGAGFDSEMTGRENIFLYGSLLGFPRRRLVERFDHIVEFAELEAFVDVPLKNYSSGMSARLGFAVATDVDADILIVDEALTVGDARFQLKCMERIEAFRARGMTILFVSHSHEQVRRLCTHALWIDNGDVMMCGPVEEVVAAYTADEFDTPATRATGASPHAGEAGAAEVDFVDISRGDGSSVGYCHRRFGGRGLAVSLSSDIAEGARRLGAEVLLADPLEVEIPDKSVRYVSLMDSIHFFRVPDELEEILTRAARWARDFVFVRMPSFEDVDQLAALGLKWYWTDWTALPGHPKLDRMTAVFDALGLERVSVKYRMPTLSSDAPSLLPLSAPPDQGDYDPELHGPKPSVAFPRPVYAQVDIFIALRPFDQKEWYDAIRPDFFG
jgi:ABC-2 type transport system ATP-binding protein